MEYARISSQRPTVQTILAFVVAAACLVAGASEALAYQVGRTSASFMNIGDKGANKDPDLRGNYAAYSITNNGAAQADVWVVVTNFTGGVVNKGVRESGVFHIGPMGAGAVKMAYFYLVASGPTTVDQSHDVMIFNGLPAGSPAYTGNFTLTDVTLRKSRPTPTNPMSSSVPPVQPISAVMSL